MPINELLAGHRRFKQQFENEREMFVRLAEEGQSPKVLWIGCSDSRVIPEQITGVGGRASCSSYGTSPMWYPLLARRVVRLWVQ
jgi:hypothetical protein